MTSSQPTAELTDTAATPTAVVRGVVPMAELAAFFDRSFGAVAAAVVAQGVVITGPAFARYHGVPAATADLEVGFPTDRGLEPAGDVEPGSLPAGPAARLVHHGSYDELGASWERLAGWMDDQQLTPASSFWEVYVTEPTPDMDPADLRTELVWPVAR